MFARDFVRHRIHSGGFQADALRFVSVLGVQKPESTEVNSVADFNRQPLCALRLTAQVSGQAPGGKAQRLQ